MRKVFYLMGFVAAMLLANPVVAQDRQLFNHLSIGAEVGTTGWGFEAAMPLTHYVTSELDLLPFLVSLSRPM